ncbi:hypothetical protein CEXT_166201 [Caerostris extrusa]|uniref:Uncharacterized protein n=1 Tax=Caerostris extrusa TaxID=172846 RepID=A0AAV4PFW3_CAEEX|nr:hypothetical protein CEXT_166201 [Caerostris extrusa]
MGVGKRISNSFLWNLISSPFEKPFNDFSTPMLARSTGKLLHEIIPPLTTPLTTREKLNTCITSINSGVGHYSGQKQKLQVPKNKKKKKKGNKFGLIIFYL